MINDWLLINYAGYPYSPTSLMPDNGLANLAGALIKVGANVLILDYCTINVINKLTPKNIMKQLNEIFDNANSSYAKKNLIENTRYYLELLRAEFVRKQRTARLLDEIFNDIEVEIKQRKITGIGFKLWNGDGIEGVVKIAKRIKHDYPKIKIFGGGPQVDVFMHKILDYNCFDGLVYGEGEEAIKYLAQCGDDFKQYHKIPNLLYRNDGQNITTYEKIIEKLDSLPMPCYDEKVYPAMRNNDKIKIIVVDESRGCTNSCAFCIHPIKSKNIQRLKSTKRLISEIETFKEKYKIHTFRFAGSSTPYSLMNEFAIELINKKINVVYSSFGHIRSGENADFETIRKSGCRSLFFGIESGSDKVLTLMRKKINRDMIIETIKKAKRASIYTVGSLIFPAPGEDNVSRKETLALLKEIELDASPIHFPIVMPRTDWYENPKKYNIDLKDKNRYARISFKWKAKMIMPPQFWNRLPFSIDNRNHKEIIKMTAQFIKDVNKLGINTSVTDEMYIMSIRAGIEINKFKDEIRKAFFSGDSEKIHSVVTSINKNI
ncbi:MAG: radical SAM protein [candidate division FCPU426 bacterium]